MSTTSEPHKETSMEAFVAQSTHDAGAPHRSLVRTSRRAVAALAAGGCLALFGAGGVAGAVTTAPDVSPIFCVAGTPCSGASGGSSTTTAPSKKAAEEAKKAAKEAEKAAKKAAHEAKKAAPKHNDLKLILGDSSLIDNGGHKWG
jgi:hypothetical protein